MTYILATAAVLCLSLSLSRGQEEDGGSDGSGEDTDLSPVLIGVIALIGFFALLIIVLTIAIFIMCRRRSPRMADYRPKDTNTYRGFSQERTQSPPESTVIHDPLSPPHSARSHSHSHSHLLPTSPITPITARPRAQSASSSAASSVAMAPSSERHTYHHLRQHEGMQPLPLDYPEHNYSSLGPRSTTPPLRPPKPPVHQLQGIREEAGGQNFRLSGDPPVSTTAPSWAETPQGSPGQVTTGSSQPPPGTGHQGEEECPGSNDDVFTRRSIYDTMSEDGVLLTGGGGHTTVSSSGEQLDSGVHQAATSSKPHRNRDGDYDKLTSPPPASSHHHHHHYRQQQSSTTDDHSLPGVSSNETVDARRQARVPSVKVVDPRYAGQYERHPDYVSPQVEIPREQLQEKYRGDYERDPAYFSRDPTRSFSVSSSSNHCTAAASLDNKQQRSCSLSSPLPNKYRGDYERSEEYFVSEPLRNGNMGTGTEQYVLKPDPNYTGAYERHPDYVPPLVKRSSKTKIHILPKDGTTHSGSATEHRPAHVPHEYTSLAAVTKDPPRQYATLNSDLSTTTSCTSPVDGYSLQKDSTV